jgi:hypothetical protein
MSQHEVVKGSTRWVFGWDQPLMTFFLQVHDDNLEEEENPVVWLGFANSRMYEVDDLVQAAKLTGLEIDREMWSQLYREKDDGV